MDTIKTSAVVKDGRITVAVPACDGTNFNVVLIPHHSSKEIDAVLIRIDRLKQEHPLPYVDPDTLKAWEEAGRS